MDYIYASEKENSNCKNIFMKSECQLHTDTENENSLELISRRFERVAVGEAVVFDSPTA